MKRDGTLKRATKLGISLAFGVLILAVRAAVRLIGRTPRGICVVIYYHAIADGHRERFARQMDVLERMTTPVRADSKEPLAPGRRYSVVTFDDGFESVLANALPALERRRIPFTIFIISSKFDESAAPEATDEADGEQRFVSPSRARGLDEDLVIIGSHTVTHPMLPHLGEEEARREISGSKSEIENRLERPISLFSFPYGGFSERLVRQCRDAGYERVFTTLPHLAFRRPDEYVVGRISAEPTDWPLEFRLKLIGAYRWLPAAFAVKRRVKRMLGRG